MKRLVGETLVQIRGMVPDSDKVTFVTQSGRTFVMEHIQDWCESVRLQDVVGDVMDLAGSPILRANEVSSDNDPALSPGEYAESYTWTFYTIATIKGYITLRWLGESNGYYSESVEFREILGQ